MTWSIFPDVVEDEATQSVEVWTPEAITATATLHCPYDQRHSVVGDLIGNSRQYPKLLSPGLYCEGASVSALIEVNTGTSTFNVLQRKTAVLKVNYSTNARKEEQLFDESLLPSVNFTTQDYREFRWGAGDGDLLKEGEEPGKLTRNLTLSRTIYNQQQLPFILISGIGGVNHVAYTSQVLGLTFAAETLLFEPGNMSRSFTTSGTDGFTVQVNFEYNPNGWNKYYRAKSQAYEAIFIADGAEWKNYPLINYSSILF